MNKGRSNEACSNYNVVIRLPRSLLHVISVLCCVPAFSEYREKSLNIQMGNLLKKIKEEDAQNAYKRVVMTC